VSEGGEDKIRRGRAIVKKRKAEWDRTKRKGGNLENPSGIIREQGLRRGGGGSHVNKKLRRASRPGAGE